jgi:hypothetical protein
MPETVEQTRPVRFLYRYWSDEHGVVGAREAALLGAILRNAWRKDAVGDGVPEGRLANFVGKKQTDVMWKVAIQRCVNWKWAELAAGYRSDSVNVVLTALGRQYAEYLCGDRYLAGLPVDGIEELTKEGEA